MVGLLVVELVLVYGIGSMLGGALGEADDAKGPVLLIGPVSVVLTLLIIWRLGHRLSTWILALLVLSGPFWTVLIFGPASEHNLMPFLAEAAVIATWPIWGLWRFRRPTAASALS
jgi:hypothetical protein